MAFRRTADERKPTNFDVWKQTLTPEFIADGSFEKTCGKYDTTCRGSFLIWAKAECKED